MLFSKKKQPQLLGEAVDFKIEVEKIRVWNTLWFQKVKQCSKRKSLMNLKINIHPCNHHHKVCHQISKNWF